MSMEEILNELINKAKVEGEEALRMYLFYLNGIANLERGLGNDAVAEEKYLLCIRSMERFASEELLKADKLQRLHTITALADLLDDKLKSSAVPDDSKATLTLRVAKLRRDSELLRKQYLGKHEEGTLVAYAAMEKATQAVASAADKEEACMGAPDTVNTWWLAALSAMEAEDEDRVAAFVQRVHLEGLAGGGPAARRTFESATGLRMMVQRDLKNIEAARAKVLEVFAPMTGTPTAQQVHEAAECQRCRSYFNKTGPVCFMCKALDVLRDYDKQLFSVRQSRSDKLLQQSMERGGVSAPSGSSDSDGASASAGGLLSRRRQPKRGQAAPDNFSGLKQWCTAHTILRLLRSAFRPICKDPSLLSAADAFFERVEALGRELPAVSSFYRFRDFQLKAYDELHMATLRIRLAEPGEYVAEEDRIWIVPRAEAPAHKLELETECARARSVLNERVSQLRYLMNVRDEDSAGSGSTSFSGTGGALPFGGEGYVLGGASSSASASTLGPSSSSAYSAASSTSSAASSTSSSAAPTGSQLPNKHMCPVCREEEVAQFAMFSCAHIVCTTCFEVLRRHHPGIHVPCPTCRLSASVRAVKYGSFGVHKESGAALRESPLAEPSGSDDDHVVVVESGTSSADSSSSSTSASAAKSTLTPTSGDTPATVLMRPTFASGREVKGSWGTKISALVAKLLELEVTEPNAKSLIFTSWEDMIVIIEAALVVNDIGVVRLQRGKKLHTSLSVFKKDPSMRALIIPFKLGAEGLNLTEATHVFFIEPLLNPMVEMQALSRVHRMGQSRETHVHRFVVLESVEDRILSVARNRLEAHALAHEGASSATVNVGAGEQEVVTEDDLRQLLL